MPRAGLPAYCSSGCVEAGVRTAAVRCRLQLAAECTCHGRPRKQEWVCSASGEVHHQPRGPLEVRPPSHCQGPLLRPSQLADTCCSHHGAWSCPHTMQTGTLPLCVLADPWRGCRCGGVGCSQLPVAGSLLLGMLLGMLLCKQGAQWSAAAGVWDWACCVSPPWTAHPLPAPGMRQAPLV